MIRNNDDASNKKGYYKTCDNGDAVPWSDLNHHVLSLIMMKPGVIDFVAFSGVCKSWRSLAISDKNRFMVSKPPMVLQKSPCNKKECYFKDFEGRMLKLTFPHLSNMELVGVTRGYLILFKRSTLDLCLVNPFTTHELHFPNDDKSAVTKRFRVNRLPKEEPRVILVFSPPLSGWVLVVLCRHTGKIWFSVAGKGTWNNVFSNFRIIDVIAFKGKIYTLNDNACRLCELRLHPNPKLTLLESKNFPYVPNDVIYVEFVRSGENLLVWVDKYMSVHELDFGEMKWVSLETAIGEYTFFVSRLNHAVAVKQESRLKYKHRRSYFHADTSGECSILCEGMWYFPNECMNIDLIDE